MPQDTTFMSEKTLINEYEISLAILHIGMMLSAWDAEADILPKTLPEVTKRIEEIFGVKMYNEPDIIVARNKIAAVIENIQRKQKDG